MDQTPRFAAALLILLLGTAAVVPAQNPQSARRPTPRLTDDDVPSSPVRAANESRAEPASAQPSAEPESGGGIVWQRNPHEAGELARSGNKLIVVDVFTDWCGWCKKMDQEIYTDSRVAALSRENIFLKLNAEDGGEGEAFAQWAGVTSYPTTVILDSAGHIVDRKIGFVRTPEAFVQFVRHASAIRPQ
jgi:thiol-disulfide isomerase/thioredoxin